MHLVLGDSNMFSQLLICGQSCTTFQWVVMTKANKMEAMQTKHWWQHFNCQKSQLTILRWAYTHQKSALKLKRWRLSAACLPQSGLISMNVCQLTMLHTVFGLQWVQQRKGFWKCTGPFTLPVYWQIVTRRQPIASWWITSFSYKLWTTVITKKLSIWKWNQPTLNAPKTLALIDTY